MTEQCAFCGNKNLTAKTTRYLHQQGDDLMIFDDTPCMECDFCGEQNTFTPKYSSRSSATIERFANTASNPVDSCKWLSMNLGLHSQQPNLTG